MSMFYEKEGVVSTSVDLGKKIMIVRWISLSYDKVIEECCQAQAEQLKLGIDKLVLDVSNATGVPNLTRQKWFETTLFPQFGKEGMKAIITVLPKSALTKMASKKWTKTGNPFDFDMYDAGSVEDAIEIASKY